MSHRTDIIDRIITRYDELFALDEQGQDGWMLGQPWMDAFLKALVTMDAGEIVALATRSTATDPYVFDTLWAVFFNAGVNFPFRSYDEMLEAIYTDDRQLMLAYR